MKNISTLYRLAMAQAKIWKLRFSKKFQRSHRKQNRCAGHEMKYSPCPHGNGKNDENQTNTFVATQSLWVQHSTWEGSWNSSSEFIRKHNSLKVKRWGNIPGSTQNHAQTYQVYKLGFCIPGSTQNQAQHNGFNAKTMCKHTRFTNWASVRLSLHFCGLASLYKN